jgi:SAM-dependent methyltransferase
MIATRASACLRKAATTVDYSHVTETPGNGITREALSMMLTRYELAARYGEGKDVLEVACGAGQGLGYIAARARSVVGGDYTEKLVSIARAHYGSRVTVLRLDAHDLPFADGSFDVVVLYEALYYLRDPERFLAECRRVLRPGGVVLISSANPERPDFNPSPHSVRYFSARELAKLLESCGFDAELFGAYAGDSSSVRAWIVSEIKRVAVAIGLIPKTMRGKELLKRLFLGKLVQMPREIGWGMAAFEMPVPVEHSVPDREHKVVYAMGQRRL